MIFRTINHKIEKKSYDIELKNIDMASGHWGNEKTMTSYLDEIESFAYDKETFDKNLVIHALKLLKHNVRIEDVKFYRIPEENKIILCAVTDVPKFKEFDTFTREMSILLKREKLSFSIVEVLHDENELIKKGEKIIPENWKFDEKLTARFEKLKHYQF